MRLIVLGTVILLAGCATNSGVVSISPNTYAVSRQAGTGFAAAGMPAGGMGKLHDEARDEAASACTIKGKTLRILSEKESQPPYILGNYPRVDLTFACD